MVRVLIAKVRPSAEHPPPGHLTIKGYFPVPDPGTSLSFSVYIDYQPNPPQVPSCPMGLRQSADDATE